MGMSLRWGEKGDEPKVGVPCASKFGDRTPEFKTFKLEPGPLLPKEEERVIFLIVC